MARRVEAPGWHAVCRFIGALLAVWLVGYLVYLRLPLVRPGSDIVYEAKFERLAGAPMFAAGDRNRVMVFGTSKVLAGFRPDEFDAAFGPGTRSVNLGLPGDGNFLPLLKAALAAGNVPTHVLLTVPWDGATAGPTIYQRLQRDSAIADTLLPFRRLPRDLVMFAVLSRFHLIEGYRRAAEERERMLAQHGWYFIRSQSHYAGNRLPDDYRLPTDSPDRAELRVLPAQSTVRETLMALGRRYGFKVVLVPSYVRRGELAAPGAVETRRLETVSATPLLEIAGPDYWLYPPANFSDPVHLNPQGARVYTKDLAVLLKELEVL